MAKLRILGPVWRSLVAHPDALCALSLGNLGALVLLLLMQLWFGLGGR
jgi:hypothetical protein